MPVLRCEAERNENHAVFAAGRSRHRPVVSFPDSPNQGVCSSLLARGREHVPTIIVFLVTLYPIYWMYERANAIILCKKGRFQVKKKE